MKNGNKTQDKKLRITLENAKYIYANATETKVDEWGSKSYRLDIFYNLKNVFIDSTSISGEIGGKTYFYDLVYSDKVEEFLEF